MPATVNASQTMSLLGRSYNMDLSTTGDNAVESTPTVGAGSTGVLTTRTDSTSGSLTIDGGSNPIATGDKIDIYWTVGGVTGMRRNVTAGTVAGQVIPFAATGSTGDNLPVAASAVTVVKHVPETGYAIVHSTLTALGCKSDPTNTVTYHFKDGSNAILLSVTCSPNKDFTWTATSGLTNPVSAGTIASVTMTHNGTASKSGVAGMAWA